MSPSSAEPSSRPLTVAAQLARARRDFADRPALLTPAGWWTFADTGEAADGALAVLAEAGALPGDRIVLALPNSAVLRILEQAVLAAGLVRVAVSPRLHPAEIAAIARDAEARVVCCAPAAVDDVAAAAPSSRVLAFADTADSVHTPDTLRDRRDEAPAWPEPAPGDTAMLLYSSGTTGSPKGAVVTHESWVQQTRRALAQLPPIGPGDVVLAAAPMAHFGGSIALDCAVAGAATVTLARPDPEALLAAVQGHGATVLPLAPVLLSRLVDAARRAGVSGLPTLRAVPYGGSPISVESLAAAADLLPGVLHQFYGLAEALAPLSVLSPADHDRAARLLRDADPHARAAGRSLASSAGRWLPGTEARIVAGELRVRGAGVGSGYWRRPELTARAFRDGWFATGDLARFDGDLLHILGRADDLIISGGYNIHPGEVERVLAAADGVADVAVLGMPHPVWGRAVVAAVVLDPEARARHRGETGRRRLLTALADRARASLADYKKPLDVHILDELPRNAAGKLDRRRLRAELTEATRTERDDNHASA